MIACATRRWQGLIGDCIITTVTGSVIAPSATFDAYSPVAIEI
jgi:hypothetical protein